MKFEATAPLLPSRKKPTIQLNRYCLYYLIYMYWVGDKLHLHECDDFSRFEDSPFSIPGEENISFVVISLPEGFKNHAYINSYVFESLKSVQN